MKQFAYIFDTLYQLTIKETENVLWHLQNWCLQVVLAEGCCEYKETESSDESKANDQPWVGSV